MPDNDKVCLIARTDNEIAEHIDTRQDLAIKPLYRVRIGEPMVTYHVLPFITDRVAVSGKVVTDFSIGEVIDTEQVRIDECSQVLF